MRLLALLGLFVICLASRALAEEVVQFAPEPDWIVQVPVPSPPNDKGKQTSFLLLQDNQMRFGNGADEFYVNYAIHVRNASDLQGAGTVTLVWHPDTQDLIVHKIEIVRSGTPINAITKPGALTVIRRETNLEAAALDGALTATLQLEGLRVGDVIHVAFTTRRSDPVLQGRSMGSFGLVKQEVVERSYFRAIWPKSKPMSVKTYPGLEGKVRALDANQMVFEYDASRLPAPIAPQGAPGRFQIIAQANFSEFQSYAEVSSLLYPHYASAMQLASNSEIRAEAEKIRSTYSDDRSRALAALQLVENSIRYLFIGFNDGGYVPAAADQTWSRKYGDCKGKTVLLLALLNELNIKAMPALVASDGGDGLDKRIPSIERFDHVLVRAQINDTDYWLDATRLADYQLERPQFDSKFALPITKTGSSLITPARPRLDFYDFESRAAYDFRRGIDRPTIVQIEHIYRGDSALIKGLQLENISGQSLDRALRDYWKNTLKWLKPDKVSFVFDRVHGVTTLSTDGEGEPNWLKSDDGEELTLRDSEIGWDASYAREPGPGSDAPFATNFPYNRRWLVTAQLPNKGSGFELVNDETIDKVLAGTKFIRTAKITGETVIVDTIEQTLKEEFPASEAAKAEAELREMYQFDVMIRKLPPGTQESDALKDEFQNILSDVKSGTPKTALTALKKLTEDPRYGQLPAYLQAQGYMFLASLAGQLEDYAVVEKALKAGYSTGVQKESFQDIELALRNVQNDTNAVAILLSQIIPERTLSPIKFDEDNIRLTMQEASGEPARLMLRAFLKVKWHPSDPFRSIDTYWAKLAALEMDRGDYEAATAALAAIETPESLIPFKVDLRYAKAVSADPSKFNIDEALARRLKFLQEAVKHNPDRLSGIRALAAVYRAYNMPEDSLKLTQKALDQVRGSPDGKSVFTDQEKYLSWLYHDNGRALFRLGRVDEGLKAFERAAHRSTGEGIDLGLSLNLAYKLISLGRAADALDEVVEIPMNSLSNYGKMVRQSSVACANAQLGRKEGAASALAYLKAHSSDAPGPYRDALLCLGDLDQAAKLIIAQLESPEQRHEVLKELQDYPKPPHWTDWDRQMRERLISVRDRADVQKVLTRFGRIEFFNIHL